MKKYNIEVWSNKTTYHPSSSITIQEAELIEILVEFANSVDDQGSGDGDYDTTIKKIIELFS